MLGNHTYILVSTGPPTAPSDAQLDRANLYLSLIFFGLLLAAGVSSYLVYRMVHYIYNLVEDFAEAKVEEKSEVWER